MRNTRIEITSSTPADGTLGQPVGPVRLLPSVTFGARAAALTRSALPVAIIAAAVVAGPTNGSSDVLAANTTCCPTSAVVELSG